MAATDSADDTRLRSTLRTLRKRTVVRLRCLRGGEHRLPDFMLIGAMKAGTTSLFAHLCRHPQVVSGIVKEPRFFDEQYEMGLPWYRAHFPLARGLSAGMRVGEASASYLFNPLAPGRVRAAVPDVKLIALLRNPVQRAVSHYFHEVEKGREKLPILDALQAEDDRLRGPERTGAYTDTAYVHFSYKRRGLYREQIGRWLGHFPRGQMLLLPSEDLSSRPRETVALILDFLGLDRSLLADEVRRANVGSARSKAQVPPGVEEYLREYYRSPNAALEELLDRRLGW